jgi:CheY-like chemotaxis protein
LASKQAPARVLVCEDQLDTAESLAALLRFAGHDVLVCHDGHAAIDQASAWRPTAAIIDIGLPGITGYAVAQYIRELAFGADVVLIGVTGYANPGDIEMARYVLENPAQRPPAGRRAAIALHP